MRHLAFPTLFLAACGGGDTGATTATTGPTVFEEVITITEPSIGVLDCYAPGDPWVAESPDPTCEVDVGFTGTVEDFEQGDPVPEASVEFFWGDQVVEGGADLVATTDANGEVAGELPACHPFTYRVTTDDGETKTTIESHRIEPPEEGQAVSLNSVSAATYAIIPALLGVTVDPALGIVAGRAYDCEREPLEGAQVIVRAEDGSYPDTQEVRYFVDEFPNREQPWTSEDGLWVAINVPPGKLTVELWAVLDAATGPERVAETTLDVQPDSINIASTYTGYDGSPYPDACLSPCDASGTTGSGTDTTTTTGGGSTGTGGGTGSGSTGTGGSGTSTELARPLDLPPGN